MVTLNTMFKLGVNKACNTSCLVKPIISTMHIQMERLYRAAKELRNISNQAELARALNQSSQTVNNWEARGISKAGLLLAQAEIGCSATWLATGDGPMQLGEVRLDPLVGLDPGTFRRVHSADQDDPSLTQIRRVKIKVQAGITGFQVEPEHYEGETQGVPTKWIIKEGLNREALVSTTVRGESMEPALYDGDVIVVNTADRQPVSGAVYVVNYEGEAVVKRMLRDAGQWWLSSDNPDQRKFHRQLCKGAECIVIGRVVRKESTHI